MSMLTALRVFSVIFSVVSPQSGMPLKCRFRRHKYCSILLAPFSSGTTALQFLDSFITHFNTDS